MTRWLVTGAGGALGSVVLRTLVRRSVAAVGVVSPRGPRPQAGRTIALDLTCHADVARALERERPTHVVHAAAMASPAQARAAPELAWRINVEASDHLARRARELGARMVFVSTDMVFDGEQAPYAEDAPPRPSGIYGRTKAEAERRVLGESAVVVRSPLLYGVPASARSTTFVQQLQALAARSPLPLYADEYRTPLWLEDAAAAVADVAAGEVEGVLHLGGPERLSRVEMGERMARALGVTEPSITPCSRLDAPDPEPRPRDLSLSSARFVAYAGRQPGRPMHEALGHIVSARGRAPEPPA